MFEKLIKELEMHMSVIYTDETSLGEDVYLSLEVIVRILRDIDNRIPKF